jgi:hypothetical protein
MELLNMSEVKDPDHIYKISELFIKVNEENQILLIKIIKQKEEKYQECLNFLESYFDPDVEWIENLGTLYPVDLITTYGFCESKLNDKIKVKHPHGHKKREKYLYIYILI